MMSTVRPRSGLLLLLLVLHSARRGASRHLPPREVLIKVQVFDSTDLGPLAGVDVEIFGNQSTMASGRTGSDGIVMATFPYRPESWVIVSAAKQGYVINSAPWHAGRIPLYASVSLYLLPQRPATLILYEDMVQVLQGCPGSRTQAWVQFQRKSVQLPQNSSYTQLVALLTAARSQYEMGGFPYTLGQESSGTKPYGAWVDLTPVAAVSAHLSSRDGNILLLAEPAHLSIPLPLDSPVSSSTSVPVWRFDSLTGLWVRNGTGYIQKEGAQLIWTFLAPQLGYWMAAFPSTSGIGLHTPGLTDITNYHTVFLLTILGSMALLMLILLCLLLYYCRRRCLKPRQHHRKLHALSSIHCSTQDQGTSTSHLNLVSGAHGETGISNTDAKLESFTMKVTHSAKTNNLDDPPRERRQVASDNRAYSSDPPSPPSRSNCEPGVRPNSQPGQLIFCTSIEQMKESMYRSVVPTLVIPAHYMRLSAELSNLDQQQEGAGTSASMNLPLQVPGGQKQQQPQQQTLPVLFNDSTVAQMNEELQALTEKKLLELGVRPHPRAWFVSLDGRSNSLVRHSYVELSNSGGGSGTSKLEAREGRMAMPPRRAERKPHAARSLAKLPFVDDTEPSSSESRTAACSPEDNALTPLLDEAPEPRGATFPRPGRSKIDVRRASVTSRDDNEPDDDGENKKSPWQRREERPLMVFNIK